MFIERAISLNSGWSILTEQKEGEWGDIQKVLKEIDSNLLLRMLAEGENRGITDNDNLILFSKYSLFLVSLHLLSNGWPNTMDFLIQNQKDVFNSISKSHFVGSKNGVTASMLGFNEQTGGDFITNLLLNIPYYSNTGQCEVMVLLAPTADTNTQLVKLGMPSRMFANELTEDDCREQLAKFASQLSSAPAVIGFYTLEQPQEIAVEEVVPLKIGPISIERILEFAPEFYQASVGLLSYFGQILRQKDPATKAKVRIEQDGNLVRLHIESPGGDIETIEEALEKYTLVASSKAPPESLVDDPGQLIELRNQLRIAHMQVATALELKQLSDGRISSLESQVAFMQQQFAAQMLLSQKQVESHERMQLALLAHGQTLFKDLLEESRDNFQLQEAIRSLHQNLLSGLTTIDVEDRIREALADAQKAKPGIGARIYAQLEALALKAGTTASLGWLAKLFPPTH